MPPRTAAVKALMPTTKTDIEIDHAVIEKIHEPGNRGESRSHDKGQGNGAVDIDAKQRSHGAIPVSQARCERPSEVRGNQQGKGQHEGEGGGDNNDLHIADLDRKAVLFHQYIAVFDHRLERFGPSTLNDLHIILQHDGHANGGDERGQTETVAQGPIGKALNGPAISRRDQHRDH